VRIKEPQIVKALDGFASGPDGKTRLFLFYGPDESGSRALAARLDRAMGADAERIDLDGATLKEDPARLADEAASISLFGGRRHIRVTGGDECTAAVIALLEAPATGDPVILIAGALKPSSTLLKAALDHPAVMACINYKPEGRNLVELTIALGRTYGLRIARPVAQRLADNCVGDRAVLEREVDKLSQFLDAAPDRPRDATEDALDAIEAGLGEADTSALINAVLGGQLVKLAIELSELADGSAGTIPALRGLARRLLQLAKLRAEVEAGKSASSVMAARGGTVFYKDRDAFGMQLHRWDAARLRTAATRVFAVEAAMKAPKTAGPVLAAAELIAIGRVGERLR